MKIYVEMPKGIETDSFLTPENIEFLESLGEVTCNTGTEHLSKEAFRDALEGMDACVCGWSVPQFDEVVLEKADKLKLIAYTAGSVSRVVTDEVYRRGIRVLSGNNAFAECVAEGTIGYILATLRDLRSHEKAMQDNGWKLVDFKTRSLLGKKVGIVGYGAVSRYLIKMLKVFSVDILLYSNHTTVEAAQAMGVTKATLAEIFTTCDVVSLHCAKNPGNYHLVDDKLLSMLKPGALLVNTSRGDVVDEEALIRHLQSGRICAALDVYEREPLPKDSPLRTLENAYLQPHLAGPTMDRRCAAARLVLEDIQRYQQGLPLENEISQARLAMMSK